MCMLTICFFEKSDLLSVVDNLVRTQSGVFNYLHTLITKHTQGRVSNGFH